MEDKQVKQDINHILVSHPASYQHRQTFPGIFINDIQYSEGSAVRCAVYHESVAPDIVLILRSEPDAKAIIKP